MSHLLHSSGCETSFARTISTAFTSSGWLNVRDVPGNSLFRISLFTKQIIEKRQLQSLAFMSINGRILIWAIDQYSKRIEDVNSCVYLESFGDVLMFFQIAAFFVCLISFRHVLYLCTLHYGEKYFGPFEKTETNYNTAYIIWSNLQENSVPEKEWHPNHVVALSKPT